MCYLNKNNIRNSILGLILGDALGVPVEFKSREELNQYPVTDLTGYGTHNQPPGTWSDDSSMTLITLESLTKGYSPENIMQGFSKWAFGNYMTPYGKTFSIGKTTINACNKYRLNKNISTCGESTDKSNGNGSLMRILPVSIYTSASTDKKIIEKSFEISSLTHSHIRAKISCALYSLIISELFKKNNFYEALTESIRKIKPYIPNDEIINFKKIFDFEILQLSESSINSSGYVIDTLEASLWCLSNSNSYKEAVLKAVNLGKDTDTTAAVTGGLAGILFGLEHVSSKWINTLAKINQIETLIENFSQSLTIT